MDEQVRWLAPDEQRAWRAFIEASLRLHGVLDRELQRGCGLSHGEYEALVRLSEAPEHRLRMSRLAQSMVSTKSRLSHLVARLEAAGWVRREVCDTDRRGAFAVLTDAGAAKLAEAAPIHLRGVREHLVDRLDAAELATLAAVFGEVNRHLMAADHD